MSKIPDAREELLAVRHEIADLLGRLDAAILLLDRRKSTYRAKGTRASMTPLLTFRIQSFARKHPRWTQQRIAERYNVTNGRVSEALHGKHK